MHARLVGDLHVKSMTYILKEPKAKTALQALKLDKQINLNKRIEHYSNYSLKMNKSTSFDWYIWNDEPTTPRIQARKVTVVPTTSEFVEIWIEAIRAVDTKNVGDSINSQILNNIDDAVIAIEAEPHVNSNRRIVYLNQAYERITGYSANDLLGTDASFTIANDCCVIEKERIRSALKMREPVIASLLCKKKDNTLYFVEVSITPLKDETGWTTHFISVLRDISKKKHLEEMQYSAKRVTAIQTMTAGLTHDLNNQFSIINGHLSLMKAAPDLKDVHELITRVESQVLKMKDSINHFQSDSKLQDHQKEDIQIVDFVESVATSCAASFGIQIHFDFSKLTEKHIKSNKWLFGQILTNVLMNSIEAICSSNYARENSITVTASQSKIGQNEHLQLFVRDTGPGIPPTLKDQIFMPYVTTKDGGNGLGLFTAQTYLSGLGGYIILVSTSEQGTTFEIGIPYQNDTTHEALNEPLVPFQIKSGSSILIMDDNKDLTNVLSEVLDTVSIKHKVANRVEDAQQNIREGNFELLLLDVNMHGQIALDDLIESAKHKRPDQKIAIISGSEIKLNPKVHSLLMKYPDIVCMQKPFNFDSVFKDLEPTHSH